MTAKINIALNTPTALPRDAKHGDTFLIENRVVMRVSTSVMVCFVALDSGCEVKVNADLPAVPCDVEVTALSHGTLLSEEL